MPDSMDDSVSAVSKSTLLTERVQKQPLLLRATISKALRTDRKGFTPYMFRIKSTNTAHAYNYRILGGCGGMVYLKDKRVHTYGGTVFEPTAAGDKHEKEEEIVPYFGTIDRSKRYDCQETPANVSFGAIFLSFPFQKSSEGSATLPDSELKDTW